MKRAISIFTSSIFVIFLIFLTALNPLTLLAKERPTIGLVLSGGGARGAAHIGVIEVLEEYNVPIDLIVGTSMGAVIGGLYAAGIPIERIKEELSTLQWQEVFKHDVVRKNAYFRRKMDDEYFIATNFIGMNQGHIHLSYGLTNGQRLYEIFNSYLLDLQPIGNFNSLYIPFRAVATDLLTGKNVSLDKGDLARAMLASMAVPGIISPVKVCDQLLVDGGVSNNLPINIAKSMGADIVIVVNVSTPLLKKEQISDITGVLGQISNILTNINIMSSEQLLLQSDILIQPIMGNIETANFNQFKNAIIPGKLAAYEVKDKLKQLSSYHPPYPHENPYSQPLQVDYHKIKNRPGLACATYDHYLDFHSSMVTVDEINNHISSLYGLNIFNNIFYEIKRDGQEPYLLIKPSLSASELLFQESLLLRSDFHDNSFFSLVLGITDPHVNRYLGEWRVVGALGSNVGFFAEYYQPLDPSLSWFINPYIDLQRRPFSVYFQFDQMAQFMYTTYETGMEFGRTFGNWGRIKLFSEYEYTDFNLVLGLPFVQEGHNHHFAVGSAIEWDRLDNLYFPHRGMKGNITLLTAHDSFEFNRHFSQLEAKGLVALSKEKHSVVVSGRYNTTLSGIPGITSQYFLGGLFQLSGLYNNELFAENLALANAIYFYEISQIEFIPNRPFPIYVGASVEAGKVWGNANVRENNPPLFLANSLFVGTDTLIGPIYLAAGLTHEGHKALHFLIGPIF